MTKAVTPRPFHEWHEDHGDVLWWLWPIEQAPWVGTPLDIGRTVSFDVTVQIGFDVYEVAPSKMGDTGGWPWKGADEETQARLYWTPLPDCSDLDSAIRDDIRGGPDPFTDTTPGDETDRLKARIAELESYLGFVDTSNCNYCGASVVLMGADFLDQIIEALDKAGAPRKSPDGMVHFSMFERIAALADRAQEGEVRRG